MRKSNREIADISEIEDLVRNMDTIRLGIHDEKYPYVVPVSFGYEFVNEQVVFYIHGANAGKKVKLLETNPYVCVEGDICYRFKKTMVSVTCLYESFIAFGRAERVSGEEALKGLKLIMNHCGYENQKINEKVLSVLAMYKITIDSITGKERTKNN